MAIGTPVAIGVTAAAVASGSSFTTTANASAGSLIVVALWNRTMTEAITSVTDSAGNTYTRAAANTTLVQELWYCANCLNLPSGGTITATTPTDSYHANAIAASGVAAASPVDVTSLSNNVASQTSVSLASGTLAASNEMLVGMTRIAAGSYGTYTQASGFTASASSLARAAFAYRVVTSNASVTYGPSWVNAQTTSGLLVSFKVAANNYSLAVTVGAFTLTGVAARLAFGRKIAAAVGAFTLTGIAAILAYGRHLIAALGTFTETGFAAALRRGYTLAVSAGAFTLTGFAAGLKRGWTLAPSAGSFALTGVDATLRAARKLALSAGSFTLTGVAAALRADRRLSAGTGSFTLTGFSSALAVARHLIVDPGAYTLTGNDATLVYSPATGSTYTLVASRGTFTLTGNDVSFTYTPADTGESEWIVRARRRHRR